MAEINMNRLYAAMESRSINGLVQATKQMADKRLSQAAQPKPQPQTATPNCRSK